MIAPSQPHRWPPAGGDVATLMRTDGWTSTALGPPADWPDNLKSVIGLMLPAHVQIVLFWGPQYVAFYNDVYAPTIGNKHPRALGRPAIESWTELWDDLEPLLAKVRATGETVSAADRPFRIERHGFLEDVYFDISYSAVAGEDGGVDGVLCIVSETTGRVVASRERERAEATLRANQEELARVNASLEERVARRTRDLDRVWRLSTDLMMISRLDGTIQAINPAWLAQLGWHPADLAGQPYLDFVHPDDRQRSLDEAARLGAGLATRHFENRWRHHDGTYRTVAWTAVPEAGFVHAVGRDITADNAAADALREAEARLRQSQKMEAVGQLTGGIAHDFNNLLQGISGSLEVVRKRIAQGRPGEVERHVDAALGATQKAASLTHRLLAFSRRQPLDPKPVRPNPLVGSMEDLLRRTLGERIALEMVLAEGVWTTLCDPNQLENALLNLAINARDAMPDGGTLEIETRNLRRGADDPAGPGEYVCISVTDTGTGMPPDVAARAFEPFFTTKPIGQGTGLGLSMIYGFALQSEGFCHIDSTVGRGTTVTLALPRHHGEDDPAADPPPDLAPRAERGEVVLVVEDDPVVRGLIVDVLTERGYRVLTATDGPTGLTRVQDAGPLDLLLTDNGLPGLDGRRLAEAARMARPGLKVLFMTGYASEAAASHGFLDAGMGIVTKPFTMDGLAARVRELLAAGPNEP